MGVKSFAYLKKSNSCIPKTREKGCDEKDEKDEKKNEEKNENDSLNKYKTKKNKTLMDKNKTLMGSRFCYGCLRFSVNYPDTDLEMGFCQRMEDGKTVFKVIQPEYLIRQCPGKVLK